jgi:hypothetical protein
MLIGQNSCIIHIDHYQGGTMNNRQYTHWTELMLAEKGAKQDIACQVFFQQIIY